jgi:hypothetical protein
MLRRHANESHGRNEKPAGLGRAHLAEARKIDLAI